MSNAPLIDFSRTPRILQAVGRRSGYQPSASDLAREAAIKALGSRIEAAIAYGARHPEQEAHCRSQARHMAQESARLVASRSAGYVRHLEALRGL